MAKKKKSTSSKNSRPKKSNKSAGQSQMVFRLVVTFTALCIIFAAMAAWRY